MIVTLIDRDTNIMHIKYFKFGYNNSSVRTLCRKSMCDTYANGMAMNAPLHFLCKKCLSIFNRQPNLNFRSSWALSIQRISEQRALNDSAAKLNAAIHWRKFFRYKYKCLRSNKIYEHKTKVFQPKKVSNTSKR